MEIEKAIAKLEEIKNGGATHVAMSLWGKADVEGVAEEFNTTLTNDEVEQVLEDVEEGMDAEYGINWESIRFAVEEVMYQREIN